MYEVFEWDALPQGWTLRGKLLRKGPFSYNIETGELKGSGDRVRAADFYAEALKVYEACRFTVTSPSTLATLIRTMFGVESFHKFRLFNGNYVQEIKIPSLGVAVVIGGPGERASLSGLWQPIHAPLLAEIQVFLASHIIQGVEFIMTVSGGRYLVLDEGGSVYIDDSLDGDPKFYWEISPKASPSDVFRYLNQSTILEAFQSLYNNFHRQNGWPSKAKTKYAEYAFIDKALRRFKPKA